MAKFILVFLIKPNSDQGDRSQKIEEKKCRRTLNSDKKNEENNKQK